VTLTLPSLEGINCGLPKLPAADPVSRNYPDATVHPPISDLYRVAKRAAPQAWLTVSGTTELYWRNPSDPQEYATAVDSYDVHVEAAS